MERPKEYSPCMKACLVKKKDNRATCREELLFLSATFLLCVPDDNSAVHAARYEVLATFIDET
jgi:hypothetical protein